MANENVLSKRYASPTINQIFSERGRFLAEREFWIAAMKIQAELGLKIPGEEIAKYETAKETIDFEQTALLEGKLKHDVKARIESFVQTAGAGEYLHQGLTSRDLTDNVEQMQIKKAGKIIFGKYVAVLQQFSDQAARYDSLVLAARTHHQPAQPTLLGRRMAMWGEELYHHLLQFEFFLETYPLRGLKGAVGTQKDLLALLGSPEKVDQLEKKVASLLGFGQVMNSPGQVYPRSLDYQLISQLALLSSAAENFAKGMRLMSGLELAAEGFVEGQVGSSAMPHKMNARSSERICGLAELQKMYAEGASRLSGDQWEEGDVSCSVVRRVLIPDSFYVADGICETTLSVLGKMGVYEERVSREVRRHLPFLLTSEILMLAVRQGMGRERAHEIIKDHAVKEAIRLKKEGGENRLWEELSSQAEFQAVGINKERLDQLLLDKENLVGRAKFQIDQFREKVEPFLKKYSAYTGYNGGKVA